jgi:hypothetical protein
MSGTATYLYCIVHASRPPDVRGVPAGLPGGSRPSLSSLARTYWLVVGDVPLDAYGSLPLENTLRNIDTVAELAVAHESVVDAFARQPKTTVVPMKLFTMFASSERAHEEMRSRMRSIQAIVRRIAGCEEWGVRLISRASVPPSRGRLAGSRPSSGVAFLAAKKEARDLAREAAAALEAAADRTFSTLATIAKDTRRREDAPAGMRPPLLDAAFLVPKTDRGRFKAAVRRLASDAGTAGADLTLTGPWPAYNFVQKESAT